MPPIGGSSYLEADKRRARPLRAGSSFVSVAPVSQQASAACQVYHEGNGIEGQSIPSTPNHKSTGVGMILILLALRLQCHHKPRHDDLRVHPRGQISLRQPQRLLSLIRWSMFEMKAERG